MMKLRIRLPLLVVPLITAPLLLAGFLAFVELKHSAQQRGDQQTQLLLDRVDAQLRQLIDSAGANVQLFAEDPLLQKYLLAGDAQERYALLQRPLQRKLSSIQGVFPQYYEIRVLLPDGFEDLRVDDGALANLTEEEGQSPFFLAMRGAKRDANVNLIAINPDNRQLALYVTRAVHLIDLSLDSYNATPQLRGYLSLTVSLQALLDTLSPSPWPQGGMLLSDARGRPLAASREIEHLPGLSQLDLSPLTSTENAERWVQLADQDYLHRARRLSDDLWIHLLIPEAVLLDESRTIGNLVLLICLAAIGLSVPLLLLVIRSQFLRPVERLNKALASLGQRQQLVQVPVQNDDEIGELSRSFNQMSLALYQSNEQIRSLAYSDSLTGLPNRLMFIKTLRREIEQARQHGGRFALLFLDLDNFKHVNDTLGHAAGDRLLVKVTEIFQANLRGYDYLSRPVGIEVGRDMARLGGDEFTLLLCHPEADQLAGPVAERIIAALAEPIDLEGSECYIGCSIGIAIYPDDGRSVEDLVKHADLAMYQAKTRGKSTYQFFSSAIAARSQERVLLDQRLHSAVEALNFHLQFQPIVDSRSLRMKSVEALIRWNDPELGMVPPDQFIPIAEENGLILPIGDWVLEQAARQLVAWKQRGLPRLRVAVNVSSVQLAQPGFARQISRLLRKHQLGADELYIELTETAVLQGREQVLGNLHALRELGIQIALDDFGTGYSSLSYLQTLPIDILKIDRSFILNLQENNNGVILSAIITMAHSLGMQVVAEGVEDQSHLSFLLAEGCDLLQGYLFSSPRPAEEIEQLIGQPLPEARQDTAQTCGLVGPG
ncbi:EAL domain-containing protein [Pseudomonas sp. LPB0260]|uniref:putative bifunctional diguanylate cyclase/phosphodiesterase n=1 Tax=Pseudomonas sp. LPB0260 TaxID=2614442 RepID=UPI0015C29BD6|nr:EAL domain-containing protein [Pseudomonas sp. LPB0260]QLC73386.1 EAL domain-containing protein [Pseudomonas sp. LPB0260]QLC76160.1 EAL domain-containing protein [Pseudomonas sp. LPB0260]